MTSEVLPKSETQPDGLIASPWHTVFVLIVVALNALRAAIFAAHSRSGLGPNRPVMYLRTILFELLVLAIVAVGVLLRGGSLPGLLGPAWGGVGRATAHIGGGAGLW